MVFGNFSLSALWSKRVQILVTRGLSLLKCYTWLGRVLTKFMSLYAATFASSFFVVVLCICVLCISVCQGEGG